MSYQRLYIDVDGVINALRHGSYRIHLLVTEDGMEQHIHMDGGCVKDFLEQFPEVVWATTWVLYPRLLDMLECNIGVDKLHYDRINLDRDYLRNTPLNSSGKDRGVAEHYDANPARSLWIDDDLGPLDKKMAASRDIVLHKPDSDHGAYDFMKKYIRPLL